MEKVTVTHMQTRLKEACQACFQQMRHDHHEWLRAERDGNEGTARFYYGIVTQARFEACRLYDLYLESLGHGWKTHFFKQNDRDVRRIKMKEAASCSE